MKQLLPRKYTLLFLIVLAEMICLFFQASSLNRKEVYSYTDEDMLLHRREGNYESSAYVDLSYEGNHLLVTPVISLGKGTYAVTIDYESAGTTGDHPAVYSTVLPEDDPTANVSSHQLDTINADLLQGETSRTYRCYINIPANVRVAAQIREDAMDGYVLIHGVTLTYMRGQSILHRCTRLLFFFVLADLAVYLYLCHKEKTAAYLRENALRIAGTVAIVILAAWPLFARESWFSNDIWYHLRRVVFLSKGLSGGVFPVRIYPEWEQGYGYAAGVFYGDTLFLPSAVLFLLGYPLTTAYHFYIWMTTVLTALFSRITAERISGSPVSGLVCAAFYTLAGLRFRMVYTGANVGQYAAYAFLPLVLLGFYEIYFGKNSLKARMMIAFGASFILQSHQISAFLLLFTVPAACLLLRKRTFEKEVFVSLAKALALTLGLSLFYLLPFLDYYINQPIAGSWQAYLWAEAAPVTHLLTGITDEAGYTGGWAALGVSSLLILCFVGGELLRGGFGNARRTVAVFFGLSLFLLFAATDAFPWFGLSHYFPALYHVLYLMQKPWRILILVLVLLMALFASALKSIRGSHGETVMYAVCAVILTLSVVQATDYLTQMLHYGRPVRLADAPMDFDHGNVAEFRIDGSSRDTPYQHPEVELVAQGSDTAVTLPSRRQGTTISATVPSPVDTESDVLFPLWAYRYYTAKSGRQNLTLTEAADHRVSVQIPEGFEGEILVRFTPPWHWRLSEIVSLSVLFWCISQIPACRRFALRHAAKTAR